MNDAASRPGTNLVRAWLKLTAQWAHVLRDLSSSKGVAALVHSRPLQITVVRNPRLHACKRFPLVSVDDVLSAVVHRTDLNREPDEEDNDLICRMKSALTVAASGRERDPDFLETMPTQMASDKIHCESLIGSTSLVPKMASDIYS
jgi:hypothetical protein